MIINPTQPEKKGWPLSLRDRRLIVRADAGPAIGTGHVMRSLALATGWIVLGGTATLVSRCLPPALRTQAAELGVGVEDLEAEIDTPTRWLARPAGAVVIDGWAFDTAYLSEVALTGVPLLVVDDKVDRVHYPGALLLNPNLPADPARYAGRTEARLLLGPHYAPLRRAFRDRRHSREQPPVARSLLVLMGGADPDGYSAIALRAATDAAVELGKGTIVRLVVGGANPRLPELRATATACATDVEIHHDVRDMAALMADADLAISAAGSTIWELCCMGVPAVVGSLNDSETPSATHLDALGAAVDLGPFSSVNAVRIRHALVELGRDQRRRHLLSEAARNLVDGRGVDRILGAIADVIGQSVVTGT